MTPIDVISSLDSIAAELDRLYGLTQDVVDQQLGRQGRGLLTTLDVGKMQAEKLARRVRRQVEREEMSVCGIPVSVDASVPANEVRLVNAANGTGVRIVTGVALGRTEA